MRSRYYSVVPEICECMKHNHALGRVQNIKGILALKRDRHGNINQATWKLPESFKISFLGGAGERAPKLKPPAVKS